MLRQVQRYLMVIIFIGLFLSFIALITSFNWTFNTSDPKNYPYKFSVQGFFYMPAYCAHDYDKDGYSEIFIAHEPIQLHPDRAKSILIYDSNFKIIEQFNTNEYVRAPLNFMDINADGKDEVLICTNNSVTAFLDVRQIPDKKMAKFPIAFTDEYTTKTKNDWQTKTDLLDFQDIDNNGLKDMVFLIATYYQHSPRGVYCYEYPTGRIKWIQKMGAAPPFYQVADLNGDGNLEYVIGTSTPDNLKIEINGTVDTLAYFMIYNKYGHRLECEQLGLNGTWTFPWMGDIDRDGTTDCIVIENNFHKAAAKLDSKIYRYDPASAQLIQVGDKIPRKFAANIVDDFNYDGFIDVFLLDTKNCATIHTFSEDGKSLRLVKVKTLNIGALQNNTVPKTFDLNLDGRKEIILQGQREIYVLDTDLNLEAIFPNARAPFLIRRRDNQPFLLVNKSDYKGCYALRYDRNYFYMFYRLKSMSLFLSVLGIIVSFLIISGLVHQIFNLPLLAKPDWLWMEITAKFRIVQMSYGMQKLLELKTAPLSWSIDSIFSSTNAENFKSIIASREFREKNAQMLFEFLGHEKKRYTLEIIKLPAIFRRPNRIIIFNETEKEPSTQFSNWLTLVRAQVHNLKNPLTTALMQISHLKKDLHSAKRKTNHQIANRCDNLEQELIQSKNVTNKFLSFIDAMQRKPRPCDVNEKLKALTKSITEQYESTPTIKFNLSPDLPIIRIGHDLFDIIIENILRNAIEATESNGEIIISTCLHDQVISSEKWERMINIEILDTGVGIDEQSLQNIFTSPVSTKPGGTGIGLSLTKEILTWLGGSIEIHSKINLGTTVNIYIPIEASAI